MRTILFLAFLTVTISAYNCVLTGGGNGYAVSIPNTFYDVTAHGAIGDGKTDNAAIFNSLLKTGQGVVVLPAGGNFLINSPINFVTGNTALCIEQGATLTIGNSAVALKNFAVLGAIVAYGINDIAVTGHGTIQGNGQTWWPNRNATRPSVVYFHAGLHTLVRDITILNPPNHHLVMGNSYTEVANVNLYAPPSTGVSAPSHNTDGIDAVGSPAWIHDSTFDTGDDDVAISVPNVLVENLVIKAGHGVSIGSLCSQAISGVTVRNIVFTGTTNGLRIKSKPGCSGSVRSTLFQNITMSGVQNSLIIDEDYLSFLQMGTSGQDKIELLKSKIAQSFSISGVTFKDITTTNTENLAVFNCLSQCQITFEGTIKATLASGGAGWQCTKTTINTAGASITPPLPSSC